MKRTRMFCIPLVAVVAAAAAATVPAGPAAAIIGGTASPTSQYPYFVHVLTSDRECGGTLIDPHAVLTAAHCVSGEAAGVMTVVFPGAGSSPVMEAFVHPLYDGDPTNGHDLAVLSTFVGYGRPPAQVGAPWDPGAYQANTFATIIGSGDSAPHNGDNQFRSATAPIRSDADMDHLFNPWYGPDSWSDQYMIGAGIPGITACYGDSGSPFIKQRTNPVVIGVASFTTTDCSTPAAYAELSGAQLAWITVRVPSIVNQWGPCTQTNGQPGRSFANYGYYTPGAQADGPYWWIISCVAPQSPPPPPAPDPTSPPPPGCRKCVEQ